VAQAVVEIDLQFLDSCGEVIQVACYLANGALGDIRSGRHRSAIAFKSALWSTGLTR
jgi:hypothetical protein